MTDVARRLGRVMLNMDDEQEVRRARAQAAKRYGGTCANCGRALADEEPIWLERLEVRGAWRADFYRAPVGRECASPASVRGSDGLAPEPCLGCGRGVYFATTGRRHGEPFCSRRCRTRRDGARRRSEAQ